MKKVFVGLLCLMLLFATVSCNQSGHDPESETMSQGTEEQSNNHETTSDSETTSDNETTNDSETDSGSSTSEESTSVDLNKLKHTVTCDGIDFYCDEQGQFYAYIETWRGTLFSLGSYYGIGDALLGETCAEIVAYTRGRRVSEDSDKDYLTVTVLKLDLNRKEIEAYSNDLYVIWSGHTRVFFNYYQEGCAYYFYLPESDEDLISHPYNPYEQRLHRYETTDGGKTWTDQTNDFIVHGGRWRQFPTVTKFVNKQVGIVGFRDISDNAHEADICSRTYFTVDCGKTWDKLPDLPYPFEYDPEYSSEVLDLEWVDNRYVLTISHHSFKYKETFAFTSEDMNNWILVEQ